MKIKNTLICLLSALLVLPLGACSSADEVTDIKPGEMQSLSSGTVAENENYILEWDESKSCALLKSRGGETVWSTVPYDFYLTDDTNINLNAPMFISYYNPSDGSLMTAKAYSDCIEMNNLSVESENGEITMTFYFEDAEISVPLTVSLTDDGLKATVKASEIKESGKTQLISVSVLPYLCSAPNSESKSDYLLVPVGSGALMYTDEEVQEFSRAFSGEVYGTDAARHLLDNSVDEETVRLPVFGVKHGDNALFAIIEQGAEAASVNADAGNYKNGYSTAYASFAVRGFDETEVERTGYSDALIYSDEYNSDAVYSVTYYPLTGDSADYNGMARLYKQKLGLASADKDQRSYRISFLGGSSVRDVAVGIPYSRIQSATTFSQAKEILSSLTDNGIAPSVVLKGFTADGTETGRIAGGYSFASKLGGKKGYKDLKEYCEENGIELYAEFETVRFNTSANGFGTSLDTALTAGKRLAAFYPLKKNIRYGNESLKKDSLLKRSQLDKAIEKLTGKLKYTSGISLSSLGNIAYSDYSDTAYYTKGGMASQVQSLLTNIKNAGHRLNTSSANAYAAAVSDSISDVPLTNGEYLSLDASVPFYQEVFGGTAALYSTPVNLSEDLTASVLRAVEGGVAPSFTVSYERSTALADTQSAEYYGSLYSGNKESIASVVSKTADFYEKTASGEISSHKILSTDVTKTVFSNGVTVLVNHGGKAVKAEGKEIPAYSFLYETNGKTVICNLKESGAEGK